MLLVMAAIFLAPLNLLACACCSEDGMYSIWTGKPDSYTVELLEEMDFAVEADLYFLSEGIGDLPGLEGLTKGSEEDGLGRFNIADTFALKTWKLDFKAANGKTGALSLPIPASMVSYKVDIHDGKRSGGGGPLLYKEWRFKGNVASGTGFFRSGITVPTTYFLVLQGRGNGCDNTEDFTHWRLEIENKKANYSFFGKLDSGTDQSVEEPQS